MRVCVASPVVILAMTLVACGQNGKNTPGFGTPTDGGLGGNAESSADSGSSVIGSGADGGMPGSPDTGGTGRNGGDGSTANGPMGGDGATVPVPVTDGSVPPVGTPLGPHATSGKLLLDIAGTTQGTDYAFLKVAGKATLGGELRLTFATGFVPKVGQKFIVVTATGGVTGAFAKITTNGPAVTPGQDATTFYVTVN